MEENISLSEQFQNKISKLLKEAKWRPLTHKNMTVFYWRGKLVLCARNDVVMQMLSTYA